ncbi:NAD(P)-dependent oxidoreductase [Sphingomonas baiyangensis]|uniref:NAD(P)-dependent oxidoreductase n=1 Tax=Sphingomonas baiyangensis TaxID=2572576 RepID=A0A4U1L9D1_9SPHN|nr:NAD(P)-dependent oxidoreductase [Sphingomonas baiyangensis]TKD53025.1 NAD(P)-dependent oxidoreductase [Sphingomonas baiyangensis]
MESGATFIGFGEAAMAFARPGGRCYDLKFDDASLREGKRADCARAGVTACDTPADALRGARMILSLVTADHALVAARTAAPAIEPGALWLDMNSVAPDTKRAAAAAIGERARYVDVAVMAPVEPAGLTVPLLVSGPDVAAALDALAALGFTSVAVAGPKIGDASAIKMIRSVMVKGLEALSAECALAAEAAGVRDAVVASLDASWPGADWARRFDYNLDRMMVHGARRAAEMDEVVATLDALGTGSAMSRATAERQRAIGRLHAAPPAGLAHKLRTLLPFLQRLKDAA